MVRTLRPRRIVEVGSGHSTRFLARAVADGRLETRITAIDPEPRASISGLKVDWLRSPVERLQTFPRLEKDDILFIDSSHQLKPGNDVDFLLNKVIPRLPAGVRVHFHDIFLPDGYPDHWWDRGYTEQKYVAPLLVSGEWDVLWSSHHMHMTAPDLLAEAFRSYVPENGYPASLWMVKR